MKDHFFLPGLYDFFIAPQRALPPWLLATGYFHTYGCRRSYGRVYENRLVKGGEDHGGFYKPLELL